MTPLIAQLYALLHRGTSGDLDFYRTTCAGGARVLELGVGSGRVAFDLVERGHRVTGLDREPALLDLARRQSQALADEARERLLLVRGDMRRPRFAERFDRVIVPYNALCCLLDRGALEECFAAVKAQLEPDGRLAFDVYRGDPEVTIDEEEDHLVRIEHDGRRWDVFERALAHDDPRRADTRYRFVDARGEEHHLVIEQRLIADEELLHALESAGMRVQSLAGGFRGEPLEDDSEHLVAVALPRS